MDNFYDKQFFDVDSFEEKIEIIPDIDYNYNSKKEKIESIPDFDNNFNYGQKKIESISNNNCDSNFGEEKNIIKTILINKEDFKNNYENNNSFFFTMGNNLISPFTSINSENNNQIQEIYLKQIEATCKNKEKIFGIVKHNKKKGRIKNNSNLIGKHNKFYEDNIFRKFKGRFIEKCRIYINKEYKKFLLNNENEIKKEKVLLQRISPELSRKITKDDNIKWLNTKLWQIFSENVSKKCSNYDLDYNVKGIIKLYRENKAKNVINILNSPVREMIEAFIQNKIPEFGSLDEDLKYLEEKMKNIDKLENIKIYLDKYRDKALNFESIFSKKHSRKNKYN